MIVDYKGQEFEQNPNDMLEETQYKGDIFIKYAGHSCMSVYGITIDNVMDMVEKFKVIEPKTGVVEIYSPCDTNMRREYIETKVLF